MTTNTVTYRQMTLLISMVFKLTGSTTAALVDLTNRYLLFRKKINVRCLLINFTKAFDSVDHPTLNGKLKNLNIADHIIQWMVQFLTDTN